MLVVRPDGCQDVFCCMEKPAEVDSRRVFLFEEVGNLKLITSCRQNNYTGCSERDGSIRLNSENYRSDGD